MCCNRDQYFEMAEAFASLSYLGVYLFDIDTNKFVYTSDSPILRCGFTIEEMNTMGVRHLMGNVPAEERTKLEEVYRAIMRVYTHMSIAERKSLNIHLNFHMLLDGRTMMVCHKLRMLDFDADGMPHLILGTVSYSVHNDETMFFLNISGEEYDAVYNHQIKDWEPVKRVQLTDDERDMLRLTMQGYSLEQIGKIIYKSTDSIKFYRRKVFSKMNVESISQAVAYATHHRLI